MPVTRDILEERWQRLLEAAAGEGFDGLVAAGRGVIGQFGPVVYVCGYTPILRASYALLAPGGEPVLFVPSYADAAIVGERGLLADVRSSGDADAVREGPPLAGALAAEIARRNLRRVGVAGLGQAMPVADYLALREALPGVELVDATALFGAVKARKSVWELEQLAASLRLAELAYEAAPALLGPGRRAREAVAELERIVRTGGAAEVLVFADRGPYPVRRTTETVYRRGDLVTVLVEVASADGFWVELGGLFALGEPDARSRALAAACYRTLAGIRELAAPGVPVAETVALLEDVAASEGLRPGLILGHGIGVDHDPPTLARADAGVFEAGHVVSVHPNFEDEEAGIGGVVADALRVTEAGCESLSRLPSELTVLGGEEDRG